MQDQINKQYVGDITPSAFVDSAPYSLTQLSDNSDHGWSDDKVAELEDELALALVEQVGSASNQAPNSPRSPHLVEVSHDESQTRVCIEITTSPPEELQNTSRPGTPA
jgi:hypothetical protein